jgi:hypothetical protein
VTIEDAPDTKPTSKLFEPVSDAAYMTALDYLRELRHAHPACSDWDLLLFALAHLVEKDMKVD